MIHGVFRTYRKLAILLLLIISGLAFFFFTYRKTDREATDTSTWEKVEESESNTYYKFSTGYIEGTLSFGTQGTTAKDKSLPVVVTAKSEEKTFDGLVQIYLPGEYGKGVSYQSALNCQKGVNAKQTIMVPQLGNASGFIFKITDQLGNVLLSRMVTINQETDDEQVTIGILSDDYESFSYLDNLSFEQNDTKYVTTILELSSSFDANAGQLASLSILLIDFFDTENLTQTQVEAVDEWVQSGGVLMIGGGADLENNVAAFAEVYGISAGKSGQKKIKVKEDEDDLGELTVNYTDFVFENTNSWSALSWITPDSVYTRDVEDGMVMALSFSLADNAFIQWMNRDTAVTRLIRELTQKQIDSNTREEKASWYIERALYAFEDSASPNIFYYGLFFIIYLFCMGIFIYDILKEIKKREYIWFIVPIISLLFTGLVVVRAISNDSGADSIFAGIQIQDREKSQNEVYVFYQSKDGKSKSMNINTQYTSVEPMDYAYAQSISDQQSTPLDYIVNNTKNGIEIELAESVPGVSQLMKITAETQERENISTGNFKVKISGDDKKFRGTIENTSDSDYRSVLLIRGMQYAILSNVESGTENKIVGSDVSIWSDENVEEDSADQSQSGLLNNLLSYLEQRYILEDNKLNQLIVIGITDEAESDLFRDNNSFDNYVHVEVNRYKISSQSSQYQEKDRK